MNENASADYKTVRGLSRGLLLLNLLNKFDGGATVGTLPAGGSSAPTEWLVRRAGAGPLGAATATHRVAGAASAEGRLP